MKIKTTEPRLVRIHREQCKSSKKEVKIKESKDLRQFADTLKTILRDE